MAKAEACQSDIEGRGVRDAEHRWLSRLVTTKRIAIVPTVNALGCDCKIQTKDGINLNQDFPYNLTDQTLCMRTITGQTINEIFRDHVFQLSFTFHGGWRQLFELFFCCLHWIVDFDDTLTMYSLSSLYSNILIISSHTSKGAFPKLRRS